MATRYRKGQRVEFRDGERWRPGVVRGVQRWPAKDGGTVRMVQVHPMMGDEVSASVHAVRADSDDLRLRTQ
jgi:hypothetical protein